MASASCASTLGVAVISLTEPFLLLSRILFANAWADELVRVGISVGSPGGGPDIWVVGVKIGVIRVDLVSTGPSAVNGSCAEG